MTNICVVGLGYVGLPLALSFKSKNFEVVGFDVSPERVELINSGKYGFKVDTEADDQKIQASTSPDIIQNADFIIIAVPTPIDKQMQPNLEFVKSATKTVAQNFKDGATIVLESTTYPGTTEEVLLPILQESGKKFFLGYSPERIDPGNKKYPIEKIPKIISGIDDESLEKVRWLYAHIINDLVPVSNTKTAEAVKIVENVFRAVNVSLVNELAMVFEKMKIDTYEVIKAADTKPFGFMPFYPGPGIGGHCIPVDPFYLTWKANQIGIDTKFINLAGEINYEMTRHVKDLIEQNTSAESKILMLGVAYKKNISDIRGTPAELILKETARDIDYNDPHVEEFLGKKSVEINLDRYDCIVLLTDHSSYTEIDFSNYTGTIIDTRNFFDKSELKAKYVGLGK